MAPIYFPLLTTRYLLLFFYFDLHQKQNGGMGMTSLPAKENRGHNSSMEKVVKPEIKFGLHFMVPDLVYKFQVICLKGNLR
jgi:hypothetical protein